MAKSAAVTTYIQAHGIVGFERDGDFYYFLTDALGSVRDIIGYNESTSQWDVLQQYRYDEREETIFQVPATARYPAPKPSLEDSPSMTTPPTADST